MLNLFLGILVFDIIANGIIPVLLTYRIARLLSVLYIAALLNSTVFGGILWLFCIYNILSSENIEFYFFLSNFVAFYFSCLSA